MRKLPIPRPCYIESESKHWCALPDEEYTMEELTWLVHQFALRVGCRRRKAVRVEVDGVRDGFVLSYTTEEA